MNVFDVDHFPVQLAQKFRRAFTPPQMTPDRYV